MTFRQALCFMLVLTASAHAGEPDEDAFDRVRAAAQGSNGKLDTEKLRKFLMAEAALRSKVPLRLEYEESRTVTEIKTGARQEFSIHVKLNGTLAKGATYRHIVGPREPRILIEKGDREYGTAQLPNGTWTAGSIQQRGLDPTGGLASFKQFLHPVDHRKTWGEFLKQYSILEATIEKNELIVFFLHPSAADPMRNRELNRLAPGGLLGWRCVFQKFDGRLRLRRVEQIVPAYRIYFDAETKKMNRKPHDRYLNKQGLRTIIGAKEFGVSRYPEFSKFKVVGGFDLPTKILKESKWAVSNWEIDLKSLKQDVKFKDADFAFRPPG